MSRDFINQHSALAEVMSLCDNKSESQLIRNLHKEKTETETHAADCFEVEVWSYIGIMVLQCAKVRRVAC